MAKETRTVPRVWLETALMADGRSAAEAATIAAKPGASPHEQLAADMATFDAARQIYQRLVDDGRKDLEEALATLCVEASLVHETADDSRGAVALCDRAIKLYERLVNHEGRPQLAEGLARAYRRKAAALSDRGDHRGAVRAYDRALVIYEQGLTPEKRPDVAVDLASTYEKEAMDAKALWDDQGAVELIERAISVYERLVTQEGWLDLAHDLARLCLNEAMIVGHWKDEPDQAIEIYERLVNQEGRRDLAGDLATAYLSKGDVALRDRAIEIYERLVNQEGRPDLAGDLARAYRDKANALWNLGNYDRAWAAYDREIEIYEQVMKLAGRPALAIGLASAYEEKALRVSKCSGDEAGASQMLERAISLYEPLVDEEGRRELEDDLTRVLLMRAIIVRTLGDHAGARALFARASVNWEQPLSLNEPRVAIDSWRASDNATLLERTISTYERPFVNGPPRCLVDDNLLMFHKDTTFWEIHRTLGHKGAMYGLCKWTIDIYEQLVDQERWRKMRPSLNFVPDPAFEVKARRDNRCAVKLCNRAIEIYKRLVREERQQELTGDLTAAEGLRRKALLLLRETEQGKKELREAIAALRIEVDRTGRVDLVRVLHVLEGLHCTKQFPPGWWPSRRQIDFSFGF